MSRLRPMITSHRFSPHQQCRALPAATAVYPLSSARRSRSLTLGFVIAMLVLASGVFSLTKIPGADSWRPSRNTIPPEQARKTKDSSSVPEPSALPLPAGLAPADWTSIRQEYTRHRHAVFALHEENTTRWQARNFSHQFLARFDGRGVEVNPDGDAWRWGLDLQSYGLPGKERSVRGQAGVTSAVERLTYNWDDLLQEWYINDVRGLEHGYSLHARPDGEGKEITFRLRVRGGLRPRTQPDRRGISFVDPHGSQVLTYTGLSARDAEGRELSARLEAEGEELRLIVEEEKARYPITIDPIIQQAYLKASNTNAGDSFGFSVAIAGDTVVVGARNEASNAAGVNGNQSDNSAPASGAAYVFVRSGGVWSQQAYLKASNTDAGDEFGYAVAISGETIVVSAPLEDSQATGVNGNQADNTGFDSGAAYVFVRSGGVWSQQAYLKASNTNIGDVFGWSVAISGDTILSGAWLEASNATGINGNQADNSAAVSGAAYVFVRSGGVWSQQAYLKASNTDPGDAFGFSLAIAGNTAVIGALFEGSSATGVNGNQGNNSAAASGAAYVFVRSGGVWSQQAYLKASNTDPGDAFGWSVSVSNDTILIGAPLESSNATGINGNQADNSAAVSGAAYVFTRSGSIWSQEAYLKAFNTDTADLFGLSVSLSGDSLVIGAQGESSNARGVNGNPYNNTAVYSGAAYLFVRYLGIWSQQAYLKASNTEAGDLFGYSVAISGETIIVGAPSEDSLATGVNGDQTDNSAPNSGAAYIFVIPPPDLVVSKTDGGAIFTPGGTGTYTITVGNEAAAGPTFGPITVTDNLPGNLSLSSSGGAGWTCTGTTTIVCTHNGPLPSGSNLPALTLTVNVGAGTPTGINSITNVAQVSTPGEINTGNNGGSVSTSVLRAPRVTVSVANAAVCTGPGGLTSVTASLSNPNQTALPGSFTAMLPPQLIALSGTCQASGNPGGCSIAAGGMSVSWNGTIQAGQSITLSYQVQIAPNVAPGTQLCINSVGTIAGVATTSQDCLTLNCPATGLLPLSNVGTSDQKPGSLLLFPYYTSNLAERKDTRLTISNVGGQLAYVHMFMMDGTSCNQADFFLCLTPKAIFSFKTSEYDPENTGFMLAVAVDPQGRPIANNELIGSAFVDDGDYQGSYGAEAFWRYDLALTNVANGFAVLGLNGTQYDAAPVQFAVEIQSPLDAPGQKIVLAPLAGDLTGGVANLGNAFPAITGAAAQIGPGLASNEEEKTVSFSALLNGGCLKSALLTPTFPRVPIGLSGLIPSGKMGLLTFRVGAGAGLLMTPRRGATRWHGIRSLHKTAAGNVAIAIPVFGPTC